MKDSNVIIVVGILVCGLFMFTNMESVQSQLDLFIWIGTVMMILLGSMVFSNKVYNENKKGNNR